MDNGITLNGYQNLAVRTAIYPGQHTFPGITYCALKLNGEAGEVAEKVGKIWRDKEGKIYGEDMQKLVLELGDVLWYIANIAHELHFSLEDVAKFNLAKLDDRKQRGVLGGSGDTR